MSNRTYKYNVEIHEKGKCIAQTTINSASCALELDERTTNILWLRGGSPGYKDVQFDPRIHTIKITVTYE